MAKKKSPFKKGGAVEAQYTRALRQVAREVGRIVAQYTTYTTQRAAQVKQTLERYAELIAPWAQEQAARTISALNQQDEAIWRRNSRELGAGIRLQVQRAPVGATLQRALRENVDLITSLPRQAGERVQDLTVRSLSDSTRYAELQEEILRTGHVTKSRAELIARTETARTASALTQTRAEAVGADSYVWRTAEDGDVRAEHKRLDGKVFSWDTPPVAGPNGERYHAGQGPNCRCYPEPIITET